MLSERECLEVMLREYTTLKEEMKIYINLFHKHTNFVVVYASVLTGVAGFAVALRGKDVNILGTLLKTLTLPWPFVGRQVYAYQALGFFAYLILASLGFFFVAATLSYIYVIEVLAARAAVVERSINGLTGRALLAWEIGISPRLIRKMVVKGVWISPSVLRISSCFFLLVLVLFFQIFTARAVMGPELGIVFILLAVAGIAFFIVQAVAYRTIGTSHVAKTVEDESVIRELSRGA